MELVKDGIRPEIPGTVDIMPQFRTLMNQCWNGEPENRLSFKQVKHGYFKCCQTVSHWQ